MMPTTAEYKWLSDQGAAFGSPGIPPRWTTSKKDTVGTAYSAASRVWFTASHGTLNEMYYPTIDRPQTRDMELLFTDGETFVHEEKRDLDYSFHYIDPDALAVRMVANDAGGRYTVTKEIICDPHHPVVLMHVKVSGEPSVLRRMKCYACWHRIWTAAVRATARAASTWPASGCCWRGRAATPWPWAWTAGFPALPAGTPACPTGLKT